MEPCHVQQRRVTTDLAGNYFLSRTLTTGSVMPAWTSFCRMLILTRENPLDLDSNSGPSLSSNFFHYHHSATHPCFGLLVSTGLSLGIKDLFEQPKVTDKRIMKRSEYVKESWKCSSYKHHNCTTDTSIHYMWNLLKGINT